MTEALTGLRQKKKNDQWGWEPDLRCKYRVRSYFPAFGARNFSSTSCPGVSTASGSPSTSAGPPAAAPSRDPPPLALLAVTGTEPLSLLPFSLAAGVGLPPDLATSPAVICSRCGIVLGTCLHVQLPFPNNHITVYMSWGPFCQT